MEKTPQSSDHQAWSTPQPEKLPEPTYMPATLALGAALLLWGFITSPIILVVGLLLVIVALAGWIGAIVHGR